MIMLQEKDFHELAQKIYKRSQLLQNTVVLKLLLQFHEVIPNFSLEIKSFAKNQQNKEKH